ncbi:MAG TPA: HAMP domain-containing protein, partial [Phenylobacterium sp.]|nr:HAMP domain-containing protein [Phenylobacterium sp.]
MTRLVGARPTGSMFVQLITLTGLTLILAQAISLYLLFNLPPPTPDFYRLSEIEQAVRGQALTFAERRPLQLRVLASAPGRAMKDAQGPAIRARLAKDLGVDVRRVVITTDPDPFSDRRVIRTIRERIAREGVSEQHFMIAPFSVAIRRDDGRWTTVSPEPAFGLSAWQQRIVLWFILSAIAMVPITYVFARRLSAPIRLFAEAAERLGRDPQTEPLVLEGPSEIGVAVRAFNDMQERLRRYVEDRTAMVGAIAHDLRTPLTRLRFRIETLPDEQRTKMAADLDQMEAMISAALTFVRDASRPGERTPLELSSLLESLCDEMAETGHATAVESGDRV